MQTVIRYKSGQKTTPIDPETTSEAASTESNSTGPFDPDSLDDVPRPKLKSRSWTLGNSDSLVEGHDDEAPWVAIAWVVVPSGLAALVLLAMLSN